MKRLDKKTTGRSRLAKRAAMVLALWLGFWVLALGLVAGMLWIPVAQLTYRSTIDFAGIAAGIAGLTLAYSLRPRWRDSATADPVEPLSRDSAQALYAMVESIGRGLGIAATVNIHLVGSCTAFISGKRNWYGKVTHLEVGLGLPLIGSLSEDELGSIFAHEFGHFIAGDLALGPWVYRTRNAISHTVAELDDSLFFLDVLFRFYGKWFLRLSAAVSREQEFGADALAAKQFGALATSNALKKVHLLDPVWSSYFGLDLSAAWSRGARLPVYAGFRQFCKPGLRRAQIQAEIAQAEARVASEFDTHPSLDERVAALIANATPSYPPLSDCLHLLGGETATEDSWYALFSHSTLTSCTWERYGSELLQTQIRHRFASSWMDPVQLPLSELIAMAQFPDELWARLRPEGISFLSPQGKRNHVQAILEEWIIACLDQRGFTLSVVPGRALEMRRADLAAQPETLLKLALEHKLTKAELLKFDLPAAAAAA